MSPALLLTALFVSQLPVPQTAEFNRDVRPILSDNCFFCHGPDKNKREAELRLDTRDGLLGVGRPEKEGQLVPVKPGALAESGSTT